MKKKLIFMALFFSLIITGCASPPKKAEHGPVFYPEPPELPRLQYLRSYTGSQDIEAGKGAFEKFVTGDQDRFSRLDKPYGAAIHEGKIYVADSNRTVMVFDLEKKTFDKMKGAQGPGKLIQPLNIFIEKNGTKYVADPVRGQVVVFDSNDKYVAAYGTKAQWKPVDVAVYGDRLYVADMKMGDIWVMDKASGETLKRFGAARKDREPEHWLKFPTNITFDPQGYLYVADAGRFQIVKLDRDGHFLDAVGELGANFGSFARPRGVATDKAGRLYAVDAAFDNVQLFDKNGRFLLFFGKAGRNPGDLFLPAKVIIDYDNVKYFQKYADPNFEMEHLVIVVSQFGDSLVNIYGFGKEKGKKYMADEELEKMLKEKLTKFKETKSPEKTSEMEQEVAK